MTEQYQSFQNMRGASDSLAKLRALGLPPMSGKAFLDVGCNEGFFCEFARRAGAKRVLGVDSNSDVIDRARTRFPGPEFRCQSWDEDISELFDVILLASALHYASDQISLLRRLLGRLTVKGVLVLEAGIIPTRLPEMTLVQRPVGDVRYFPSMALLEMSLPEYVIRVIGDSVRQDGDSVERKVIHIVKRHPTLLVLDQESYSGKSAVCSALVGPNSPHVSLIGIDDLLDRILHDDLPQGIDDELIQLIKEFCETQSAYTGNVIAYIFNSGILNRFIKLILNIYGAHNRTIIWDGYIPDVFKKLFYEEFENFGYIVWRAMPIKSRDFEAVKLNDIIFADGKFRGFRSKRSIRFHLDMITSEEDRITLWGWSLDLQEKSPLVDFSVCVADVPVEIAGVKAIARPDANELAEASPVAELGYEITITEESIARSSPGMSLANVIALACSPQSARRFVRLFGIDCDGGIVEATYAKPVKTTLLPE